MLGPKELAYKAICDPSLARMEKESTEGLTMGPSEDGVFAYGFTLRTRRGNSRLLPGMFAWVNEAGTLAKHKFCTENSALVRRHGNAAFSAFGSHVIQLGFEYHLGCLIPEAECEDFHACVCKTGLILIAESVAGVSYQYASDQAFAAIAPPPESAHDTLRIKANLEACAEAVLRHQVNPLEGAAHHPLSISFPSSAS